MLRVPLARVGCEEPARLPAGCRGWRWVMRSLSLPWCCMVPASRPAVARCWPCSARPGEPLGYPGPEGCGVGKGEWGSWDGERTLCGSRREECNKARAVPSPRAQEQRPCCRSLLQPPAQGFAHRSAPGCGVRGSSPQPRGACFPPGEGADSAQLSPLHEPFISGCGGWRAARRAWRLCSGWGCVCPQQRCPEVPLGRGHPAPCRDRPPSLAVTKTGRGYFEHGAARGWTPELAGRGCVGLAGAGLWWPNTVGHLPRVAGMRWGRAGGHGAAPRIGQQSSKIPGEVARSRSRGLGASPVCQPCPWASCGILGLFQCS